MSKKLPLYPHVPKGKKYVRILSGPHIGSTVERESWERERRSYIERGERPPEVQYL